VVDEPLAMTAAGLDGAGGEQIVDPARGLGEFFVSTSAGGKTVSVSATVQGIPLADGTTSPPMTNTTAYTFTPAIAIAAGPVVCIFSVESSQLLTRFGACSGGCPLTVASGATSDARATSTSTSRPSWGYR